MANEPFRIPEKYNKKMSMKLIEALHLLCSIDIDKRLTK
jgi:hypothetical protein